MKTKIIYFLLLLSASAVAQKPNLELNFENTFAGETISFGKEYTNAHGEKLTFTLLNYFISNIQLVRTDGSVYVVPPNESYFLVKQSEPTTSKISLNIPEGKYKSIAFMIGVDSLRSAMGSKDRQGVLDVGSQARGMYWQWNSGYIFFKMEGKSPTVADSMKNTFRYHIGGYGGFDSKTINNIRTKRFSFAKPAKVNSKTGIALTVKVKIDEFFHKKNPIYLAKNPSVMWGPVSVQIAGNYVEIFTLNKVKRIK